MIKKVCKPLKDVNYLINCHYYLSYLQFYSKNIISIIRYMYHQHAYLVLKQYQKYTDELKPYHLMNTVCDSIASISSINQEYHKYSIPLHTITIYTMYYQTQTQTPYLMLIPIGIDVYFDIYENSIQSIQVEVIFQKFLLFYIYCLIVIIQPFYGLNPLAKMIASIMLYKY